MCLLARPATLPAVDVMPLGRVLGLLLARHTSSEAGSATLLHFRDGGEAKSIRLFWRSADTWRVEQAGAGSVSDGYHVQEWHGQERGRPTPARPGWPNYWLQLVFPLRGHFWGRIGDDYYPASTSEHPDGVRVDLAGIEDNRTGHLVVDPRQGFIRQMSLQDGRRRLELTNVQVGPLAESEMFRVIK